MIFDRVELVMSNYSLIAVQKGNIKLIFDILATEIP